MTVYIYSPWSNGIYGEAMVASEAEAETAKLCAKIFEETGKK